MASATRCEDSRLRLQTLITSTPSIARSPGICLTRVLLPAPITPIRIAIWNRSLKGFAQRLCTRWRHDYFVRGRSVSTGRRLPQQAGNRLAGTFQGAAVGVECLARAPTHGGTLRRVGKQVGRLRIQVRLVTYLHGTAGA